MQQTKATKRLIGSRTSAAVLALGFTLTAVLVIATLAAAGRMPLVGVDPETGYVQTSVGSPSVDRADYLNTFHADTSQTRPNPSVDLDRADKIERARSTSSSVRSISGATSLDRADRIALMEQSATSVGGLLLGGGTAVAGSPSAERYGPCRIEDAAFLKCVHYKLQEAMRLGKSRDGDCSRVTGVITDATYLYWTCKP